MANHFKDMSHGRSNLKVGNFETSPTREETYESGVEQNKRNPSNVTEQISSIETDLGENDIDFLFLFGNMVNVGSFQTKRFKSIQTFLFSFERVFIKSTTFPPPFN